MDQEKNSIGIEFNRIPDFMMNLDVVREDIGEVIKRGGILQGVFFMGILLSGMNGKIIDDYDRQIDFFKENLEYILLIFGKIMGENVREEAFVKLSEGIMEGGLKGLRRWQEVE